MRQSKVLWTFLIFAIALGLIWEFFPLKDAKHRLETLPLWGDHFLGKDLAQTDLEKEYFSGVNMVKRVYNVGGDDYFIYLLDGTKNRHAIHDPTFCFKGGGWEITDQEEVPLDGGVAALYKLQKGEHSKEVLMWFSDGKRIFHSPIQYWFETMVRRLTLGAYSEEPVLIVVQHLNQGQPINWNKLLEIFPDLQQI